VSVTDPVGVGLLAPALTATVTVNPCAVVMFDEDGVTVTVGIALATVTVMVVVPVMLPEVPVTVTVYTPGVVAVVVVTVRVAVPGLVPVMLTGVLEPKLREGGEVAPAGLEVMAAVSTTLPVKPPAGVTVMVEVFPTPAPTPVPLSAKPGGPATMTVAVPVVGW
jgi:hypothetical protein